jgi:hypothetical protein
MQVIEKKEVEETMPYPRLVVHSDWSQDAAKRWKAHATWSGMQYELHASTCVGPLNGFFAGLLDACSSEGKVLAGFDFPIGVPNAYASLAGIANFVQVLPQFGQGAWTQFYDLAITQQQIGIHRPFYPYAPGGKRVAHLVTALNMMNAEALLRSCEMATPYRNAACILFWTLGAKQVGRAAISGWRDLLSPGLADPNLAINVWPFHGGYQQLIGSPCRIIVTETYPAEGYVHLGFPRGKWSKRVQADRKIRGGQVATWAQQRGVVLSQGLQQQLADGFGASPDGEDPFDAVIGLCSMLEVVLGYRLDGAQNNAAPLTVEGWIFGQQLV